jgi:hypothetical protein
MGEPLSFIGQTLLVGFSVSVCLLLLADDARHRRWIMIFGLGCLASFILFHTIGPIRMGVAALVAYWYWHLFRTKGEEEDSRRGVSSKGSEPAIEAAVEQNALAGDVARIRR